MKEMCEGESEGAKWLYDWWKKKNVANLRFVLTRLIFAFYD